MSFSGKVREEEFVLGGLESEKSPTFFPPRLKDFPSCPNMRKTSLNEKIISFGTPEHNMTKSEF